MNLLYSVGILGEHDSWTSAPSFLAAMKRATELLLKQQGLREVIRRGQRIGPMVDMTVRIVEVSPVIDGERVKPGEQHKWDGDIVAEFHVGPIG